MGNNENAADNKHHEWKLIVDNDPYVWHEGAITGKQIRVLASVPDGVQVWKKNHGSPDTLVDLGTVIDLTQRGTECFSLQEASSGAGDWKWPF